MLRSTHPKPMTEKQIELLRKALARTNGRRLAQFRPKTEPNKKREAKKTGAYYGDS